MRLLDVRCDVVCRAKFEASGVLKGLTREDNVDVELSGEPRRVDERRGTRGDHYSPRGLRGLKNLSTNAMKRKAIPAQRSALSSVRIPQARRTAAISINASFAIVNGLMFPSSVW